ncbi:MAG: hypothetical protein WC119_02310 [Synergistaceae bacterium]
MAKKTRLEEILEVQARFKEKFPEAVVGILHIKENDSIRFEVRVKDQEAIGNIPLEFEGYPVRTIAVPEKKYNLLMEADRKAKEASKV